MQRRQFEDLSDELYEMVIDTLLKKGVEYQKDGNVFSNFEENAKDLGLTKYLVLTHELTGLDQGVLLFTFDTFRHHFSIS